MVACMLINIIVGENTSVILLASHKFSCNHDITTCRKDSYTFVVTKYFKHSFCFGSYVCVRVRVRVHVSVCE